jgi:predicted small secreted protein
VKIDWKHLIAPAIALVIIALCVSAYVSEHVDRIKAEAAIGAKQQIIAERDKVTADFIQALKDQAAKVTKPEQVAAALPQVIQLPAPVVQVQDRLSQSDANLSKGSTVLPDAAYTKTGITPQSGDLIIPKIDVVPLYQQLNTCKQNDALLSTCQQNLKDTKGERDEALTAVKGGSFFTRVKRNAKWFALGGAVGAAAAGAISIRH